MVTPHPCGPHVTSPFCPGQCLASPHPHGPHNKSPCCPHDGLHKKCGPHICPHVVVHVVQHMVSTSPCCPHVVSMLSKLHGLRTSAVVWGIVPMLSSTCVIRVVPMLYFHCCSHMVSTSPWSPHCVLCCLHIVPHVDPHVVSTSAVVPTLSPHGLNIPMLSLMHDLHVMFPYSLHIPHKVPTLSSCCLHIVLLLSPQLSHMRLRSPCGPHIFPMLSPHCPHFVPILSPSSNGN